MLDLMNKSQRNNSMAHEVSLTQKVIRKYKVMIVRHKISFMAAQQGMTIKEMFLRQILKTNEALKSNKIVRFDRAEEE